MLRGTINGVRPTSGTKDSVVVVITPLTAIIKLYIAWIFFVRI